MATTLKKPRKSSFRRPREEGDVDCEPCGGTGKTARAGSGVRLRCIPCRGMGFIHPSMGNMVDHRHQKHHQHAADRVKIQEHCVALRTLLGSLTRVDSHTAVALRSLAPVINRHLT